jgi:ATP-dependent helicase/nuclease subunit A
MYRFDETYAVVWWDPRTLALDAPAGYGLRRDDLISKDGDPKQVAARLAAYRHWESDRDRAVVNGRVPSLNVTTATTLAVERSAAPVATASSIEVLDVSHALNRPFGARFGTLVHATLATVRLDASADSVAAVASVQARILPAAIREPYTADEVQAAATVVSALIGSPLFDRIRQADARGGCERELPIAWKAEDGTLVEGTIDLAFVDADGLTVIDFKTDRELATDLSRYTRQLELYCRAIESARGVAARGLLVKI